jgi:teichuronic acid biosynthesis glycosyltransferase TuaG
MKANKISKFDLSVVIPIHNAEKTIEEALSSVVSQHLPENFTAEIILVDDQSTDNSMKKATEFLENKGFSFKALATEHQSGPGGARTLGVKNSSADLIAFIDSDDIWAEDKLLKQLEALKNSNAVMCSTGREFLNADGTHTGVTVGVKPVVTYKDLLKTNSISLSSVVIKREALLKYPMTSDTSVHEDYICWLKVLKEYGTCVGIDEPLLYYRKSDTQVSAGTGKTAVKHLKSLRQAGINPFMSVIYFVSYAVNGVIKHKGFK